MAKTKLRIITNGTVLTWRDALGNVFFECDADRIPEQHTARPFLYGVKQAVSDAAAGKSYTEARRAMAERFEAMVAGTWGERKAAAGKHGALWAALVRLGLTTDNAEQREKFTKLPESAYAMLYKRDDVAAELADETAETALEDFIEA